MLQLSQGIVNLCGGVGGWVGTGGGGCWGGFVSLGFERGHGHQHISGYLAGLGQHPGPQL
jgi:hypothetical protein